ncbi:MAG: phage tail protein [Desulfovibrionaceae bacterium]
MGSSGKKSQTVGYRYYLGVQAVVAHNLDAVLGLMFGEQYGWTGERTANGRIEVSAASLFGGESQQGGVSGGVDLCLGGADQGVNDYLASAVSGPVSALRGVASLVFRQFYFGNNPYLRQLKVLGRRILARQRGAAQWYAARAEIGDGDMNPAHILRECLTDADYGRGLDEALLDDAAWRAAADTLHAEGFGLSVLWSGDTAINDFVQTVLEIIDAVLYDDYEAGTIVLRLIRDDYDPDTLAELGPDEIVSCGEFSRPALGQTTTELHLAWLDTDNTRRTVYERDPAAAAMQGTNVAETLEYVAIRSAVLAQRVCARELRQRTGNLATVKLTCTRAAEGLKPGDVVRWRWPEFGVTAMVLRVVRVSYGTHAGGAVGLECVEDVFGQGASLITAPAGSWWSNPVSEPRDAEAACLEAPYWFVVRDVTGENEAVLGGFDQESGVLLVLAAQPSADALDFRLLVDSGAGWADIAPGTFTPAGQLAVALDPTDTVLTLAGASDLAEVEAGDLAFVGGEIVLVQAVSGATLTVARGVLDTVPAAHAVGDVVYFDAGRTLPSVEYAAGEGLAVKVLPRTGRGTLAAAAATQHAVGMNARAARPYPPGRCASTARPGPRPSWASWR